MLNFYQHLPLYINPVAFQIGDFAVRWYALMYLVAFAVIYFLLAYRIKKQEANYSLDFILDFLLHAIFGLLIGARLGYVLFYNLPYYLAHPLEAFLPISVTGYGLQVTGYYGMSYFGGVIGIILAGIIFCKKFNINFWQLADFVIPAIPAGYFFGRLGNFLNGELFGRATENSWGMYFPADPSGILRHPSQLFEAFFEGLVLFVILWASRNIKKSNCHPEFASPVRPTARDSGSNSSLRFSQGIRFRIKSGMTTDGGLLALYSFLYGFFRFFIEFFREPDSQIGLFVGLSYGQWFSVVMMLTAFCLYFFRERRYNKCNDVQG